MPMPVAMVPEQQDDDFTFPAPPHFLALACDNGHHHRSRVPHLPCSSPSSSPPVWLLSSPIRRSFSAADCAASPWRARVVLRRGGACSPALSDYAGGFCDGEEEEEEEKMDSLWEDLNDEEAGGEGGRWATKEREAAVLGASRSSRRRAPGLVVMMRALKKLFVAHKGKSKVHKVDEQSTASAKSASSCTNSCNK